MEWTRGEFVISTDRNRLDRTAIHAFLVGSYWSPGIPRDVVDRAIENSLCFGVYDRAAQVGFARVITDSATFAYVSDVFVLESHRGRGLSRWLMEVLMAHPDLRNLRRWMLATADAQGLYEKFGFRSPAKPERLMEIVNADVYRRKP